MKIFKIILLAFLFISGCSTIESSGIKNIAVEIEHEEKLEVKPPLKMLRLGEKLTYGIYWLGIPVGTAVFNVKEISTLNGRRAYHIISTARSNKFCSTFYKVNDEIHTYIDEEKLHPLRFEKHLREGAYRVDEVVEYDQINHMASYKSKRQIKKKQTLKDIKMPIPEDAQDPFSCLYYFRSLDEKLLKEGQVVFMKVNTEGKNWDMEAEILKMERMELVGMGEYDAFLIEPKAKFEGIFVRKGRMWIWFSADERRLPLILRTKVPVVGSIYAVLEKEE